MKKIYALFAAALMTVSLSAASFGILVNGKMYFAGEPAGEFEGFTQYLAHVPVKAGDYLQLCDAGNNYATWAVDLNSYSEPGFAREENQYSVSVTGCYDFYIKIKNQQDQLYIGQGSNCGEGVDITGGQGGQGGGSTVEGNPRFYYKMYTKSDDTWHEPSEETIFDHGVAEVIDYTGDAYVFVLFQVDGQGGVQYRTEEFMDATHRSVKLVKEGPKDWQLPAGVTNLYLYDDGNDTYTLSADPIPGKKLADPQPVNQGIDETAAPTKARKVIIDGQLRIVYGDKIFDATGRQVE